MKKRPMTLIAGILGTLAFSGYVITTLAINLLAVFAAGVADDIGSELGAAVLGLSAIMMMAMAVIFIVPLILNACSISGFKASPEKYAKKKGVIIAAIVFNFLAAIGCFVIPSIENIIIGVVLIACAVLYIVDLALENKRNQAPQA